MRLIEIQRTKSETDPYVSSPVSKTLIKKIKRIPGSERYGYIFAPTMGLFIDATHEIILFDLKHPRNKIHKAGLLLLKKWPGFPLPNTYQEKVITIDDQYRGQGVALNLYGIATKLLGMTIVADEMHTSEARNMWMNLSQIPGVEVFGFSGISTADWNKRSNPDEIYDEDDSILVKALVRAGGKELGSNSDWTYIGYPVTRNNDKKELRALQKSLSIYSNRHPESGGTMNSLYARWVG